MQFPKGKDRLIFRIKKLISVPYFFYNKRFSISSIYKEMKCPYDLKSLTYKQLTGLLGSINREILKEKTIRGEI